MESKYNARHAREILEPCGLLDKYLSLDDRGVWPAFERDLLMQAETEGLRWQPDDELQDLPDAPEAIDTPMLPFPFTARQLAAFMLAGTGALVADFYGDWSDGPDRDSLNNIDPKSHARRAVVEAFAAYRVAKEEVGKFDLTPQTRRDLAHKAYWQEPSNKAHIREFNEAQAAWDAAYQDWLTAMVRCLLVPEVATEAVQVAPVVQANTPLPTWSVKRPVRYGGYTAPLHTLLSAACRKGESRPTARDVVEAWRINKPPEIAQVLPDGFDYYDSKGETKAADLAAIRGAIKRLIDVR